MPRSLSESLARSAAGPLLALALLLPAARAWAYRPLVSTDAAVADPREVEIEFGYFNLQRAEGKNTFIVPQTVLNYGLLRDVEIVGEVRVQEPQGGDAQLAEPGLFLKAVLREGILQEKDGVGFAVEAGPLLPSTAPRERRLGFEAIGIFSGRLAPLTLHVNFGGGVDRTDRSPFAVWGVIGELPLVPTLRLVGEVNGEIAQAKTPDTSGLLGLIWHVPATSLFLDAGVRRGFTHGSPGWQVTIGLTYGFPLPPR